MIAEETMASSSVSLSSTSLSSSSSKNPLVMAKQNLCSSLTASEWKAYLALLKQWFKRIITKETFDAEARKLCSASASSDRRCLQRHNEFLLAIFSTCQSLSNGSGCSSGVGTGTSAASSPAAIPSAATVKFAVNSSPSSGGVPDATGASSSSSVSVVADSAPVSKSSKLSASDSGSMTAAASKPALSTLSASIPPAANAAVTAVTPTSLGGASPASSTTASNAPSSISVAAAAPPPPPPPPQLPPQLPPPPNASPSRTLTSASTPSPTQAGVGAAKSTKEKRKKETKLKKAKTNKISFHNNFTPTNPLAYCQQIVPKPPEEEQGLSFTYRDRTLPDSSLIHGRMLVAAWDVGLEIVDEAAVRFLQVAIETHVRALLLKLVQTRNSYKVRGGRFPTNFSGGVPNVYSRHAGDDDCDEDLVSSPTCDEEASAMLQCGSAVGFKRKPRSPLKLFHLRDALQRHRNVVASHTVYAINMERIFNAFEHQTVDEDELEDERRKDKERRLVAEQRQLLTGFW